MIPPNKPKKTILNTATALCSCAMVLCGCAYTVIALTNNYPDDKQRYLICGLLCWILAAIWSKNK